MCRALLRRIEATDSRACLLSELVAANEQRVAFRDDNTGKLCCFCDVVETCPQLSPGKNLNYAARHGYNPSRGMLLIVVWCHPVYLSFFGRISGYDDTMHMSYVGRYCRTTQSSYAGTARRYHHTRTTSERDTAVAVWMWPSLRHCNEGATLVAPDLAF
jgi:hypothetical protein